MNEPRPLGSGAAESPLPNGRGSSQSPIKRHAGEAHAFVSLRMHVAVIAEQLAGARANRIERCERRRQTADVAQIALAGNQAEVAVEIDRLRMPNQGLVQLQAVGQQAIVKLLRLVELRAD